MVVCDFCRRLGIVGGRGDVRHLVALERDVDPAHDHHPDREFFYCADEEECRKPLDAASQREAFGEAMILRLRERLLADQVEDFLRQRPED